MLKRKGLRSEMPCLAVTLALPIAIACSAFPALADTVYGSGEGTSTQREEMSQEQIGPVIVENFVEDESGDAASVDSGVCGTCSWVLDSDGTLTISAGTLASFTQSADWPWSGYSDRIETVRLDGRVYADKSLYGIFMNCSRLADADLSSLSVSRTQNMSSMFSGCSSLAHLDVSGWDTSYATNMTSMFSGCSSLTSLDVSEWNTARATYMNRMFYNCSSLTSLDLSNWDTRVYDYYQHHTVLPEIDISNDTGDSEEILLSTQSSDSTPVLSSENGLFGGPSSFVSVKLGPKYTVFNSAMMPDPANSDGRWWSQKDSKWYTKREIVSGRSGVADTYTSQMPTDPDLSHDGWVTLISGAKGYAKGGSLVTGWLTIADDKYWFDGTGAAAQGWTEISGQTYYFRDDGTYRMACGWATIQGQKYLFRADGRLGQGWITWNGSKYYADAGVPRTGWQEIAGTKYYFRGDGDFRMASGWATIGDEKRLFRADGRLADGWVTLDGASYYADAGVPREGWQDLSEGRRYFRLAPDYRMAVGWTTIGSETVQFDSLGRQIG